MHVDDEEQSDVWNFGILGVGVGGKDKGTNFLGGIDWTIQSTKEPISNVVLQRRRRVKPVSRFFSYSECSNEVVVLEVKKEVV